MIGLQMHLIRTSNALDSVVRGVISASMVKGGHCLHEVPQWVTREALAELAHLTLIRRPSSAASKSYFAPMIREAIERRKGRPRAGSTIVLRSACNLTVTQKPRSVDVNRSGTPFSFEGEATASAKIRPMANVVRCWCLSAVLSRPAATSIASSRVADFGSKSSPRRLFDEYK